MNYGNEAQIQIAPIKFTQTKNKGKRKKPSKLRNTSLNLQLINVTSLTQYRIIKKKQDLNP